LVKRLRRGGEVKMKGKPKTKPKVVGMSAWKSGPDNLVPGCTITSIAGVEGVGEVGLYFMPPGKQTTVFSMEDTDDGTADEYYGLCHEFYYILVGEFTMCWGKDTSKVRRGAANKLVLKAGDLGHWTPGWKYSVKNTGNVPGTFFWGITSPPKGTKTREIAEPPPELR
jgi:mannose-6-phosphate isomerase-like protein (cupin superfamily)